MRLPSVVRAVFGWPLRRWAVALAVTVLTGLLIAIPTDLIDTPLFTRDVPPQWWSWPTLILNAILSGLLTATYVARPAEARNRAAGRVGAAGAIITFFAVGCPVCNKLVLLALGYTGALQFFEPVQPYLAGTSVILLTWALISRIRRERTCKIQLAVPRAATDPDSS